VCQGRLGIGVELKPSYYRQAVKNLATAKRGNMEAQIDLLADAIPL
jgi:hypothetical protein